MYREFENHTYVYTYSFSASIVLSEKNWNVAKLMKAELWENWELQKLEKAQASILMILLYFFSLLFTAALFKLKMVVSIAVKSTRKIIYSWRLLGTKFNEVLFALFYVKG